MSLNDQPIGQLRFKEKLLEIIIEEFEGDPRLDEPKRQLEIIREAIRFKENENKEQDVEKDEDPKNLVVGLKTLDLRSSSSSIGSKRKGEKWLKVMEQFLTHLKKG